MSRQRAVATMAAPPQSPCDHHTATTRSPRPRWTLTTGPRDRRRDRRGPVARGRRSRSHIDRGVRGHEDTCKDENAGKCDRGGGSGCTGHANRDGRGPGWPRWRWRWRWRRRWYGRRDHRIALLRAGAGAARGERNPHPQGVRRSAERRDSGVDDGVLRPADLLRAGNRAGNRWLGVTEPNRQSGRRSRSLGAAAPGRVARESPRGRAPCRGDRGL